MGLFDKFKKQKDTNNWQDAYRANAKFYAKEDGTPFCAFALTEDTPTILPKNPHYAVEGKELNEYKLVLVSSTKGDVIGDLDFFEGLYKLKEFIVEEKEEEILIKALSLEELESLLEKSNIQIGFENNLKYISSDDKDVDTIQRQFQKTQTRNFLTVGTIDCPTGKIMIGDPLAYMPRFSPILEETIEPGEYPIEVAICRSDEIGIRMSTVRLKFKDTPAVSYQLAKPTEESAAFVAKDGVACGFPVDAGMLSICDAQVGFEYNEFLENWHKENENKNHYDDYFAKFFKESDERLPQYQREGGDFIEWENPNTHHRLVMVASGFGDGFYQFYWGYDSDNNRCELIIPLVNPDLFGI